MSFAAVGLVGVPVVSLQERGVRFGHVRESVAVQTASPCGMPTVVDVKKQIIKDGNSSVSVAVVFISDVAVMPIQLPTDIGFDKHWNIVLGTVRNHGRSDIGISRQAR